MNLSATLLNPHPGGSGKLAEGNDTRRITPALSGRRLPAKVVTVVRSRSMRRMQWLPRSTTKMSPVGPTRGPFFPNKWGASARLPGQGGSKRPHRLRGALPTPSGGALWYGMPANSRHIPPQIRAKKAAHKFMHKIRAQIYALIRAQICKRIRTSAHKFAHKSAH